MADLNITLNTLRWIRDEIELNPTNGACGRFLPGIRDAIELLEGLKPARPLLNAAGVWMCGNCGFYLYGCNYYCPRCGKKVKFGGKDD